MCQNGEWICLSGRARHQENWRRIVRNLDRKRFRKNSESTFPCCINDLHQSGPLSSGSIGNGHETDIATVPKRKCDVNHITARAETETTERRCGGCGPRTARRGVAAAGAGAPRNPACARGNRCCRLGPPPRRGSGLTSGTRRVELADAGRGQGQVGLPQARLGQAGEQHPSRSPGRCAPPRRRRWRPASARVGRCGHRGASRSRPSSAPAITSRRFVRRPARRAPARARHRDWPAARPGRWRA